MEKKHLFLMRHCKSLYNEQNKISGQTDCKIINYNIDYSALKKVVFSKNVLIICSPLSRCLDTINYLQETIHTSWPVKLENQILERGMGEWEGKDKDKIVKCFPEYFINSKFISTQTPIGGEKYEEFVKRVFLFTQNLEEVLVDNHVIICSHNQTLRMIKAMLNKIDYDLVPGYENGVIVKLF